MEGRPDPAELRAKLLELLTAHAEVDFAYLFGSFAAYLRAISDIIGQPI